MIPISDTLQVMLNDQIGREIGNSHLYRIFASWAHVYGLRNIEKFFSGESAGEVGHANLLISVLDRANVQVAIPDIPKKQSSFSGCEEIAALYEVAEVETTDKLDAIYKQAELEGNVGVSNVLQGMLEEQVEEQGLTERFKSLVQQAAGNLILLDLIIEKISS